MATERGSRNALERALDAIEADVINVGVFDDAGMFRERRLRRADLLSGAETAVFANVPSKWDSAESILFPDTYRGEKRSIMVRDLSGPIPSRGTPPTL